MAREGCSGKKNDSLTTGRNFKEHVGAVSSIVGTSVTSEGEWLTVLVREINILKNIQTEIPICAFRFRCYSGDRLIWRICFQMTQRL